MSLEQGRNEPDNIHDHLGLAMASALLPVLMREIRLTVRGLRRKIGFTASVVVTLALAIGVTTSILSAVEAILLQPIPHVSLDRVVAIESDNVAERLPHLGLDPWEVAQLERRHDLFTAVAGYRLVNANLSATGSTDALSIACTTGEFFQIFANRPLLGRVYESTDVRNGSTNVVVLGYEYWRARTGADANIVGKAMRIDDTTYTVVGVLAAGFNFPAGAQVWTPRPLDPLVSARAAGAAPRAGLLLPTLARVRPNVSMNTVQTELHIASASWSSEFPAFFSTVGNPELISRSAKVLLASQLHAIVLILVGAVALLLMAACANVASLQLVRASGRARETALHTALGASRVAVLRYQALESLLLAFGGGVLGVGVAYALIGLARQATAVQLIALHSLRMDGAVLAAAFAIMLVAAVIFGAAPALRVMRVEPADVLRVAAARSSSAGTGQGAFLRGAVVTQVALALMLILCAGTALLSLRNLLRVDPGFRAEGVITAHIELPAERYPTRNLDDLGRRASAHQELLHDLASQPGVSSVATADAVPLSFVSEIAAATHRLAVTPSVGPTADRAAIPANSWSVDDSYFRTMGIPFVAGSTFPRSELAHRIRDSQTVPLAVVIDEPLAKRLFPGESPIGRIIGPAPPGLRVVGVVAPTRQSDLAKPVDAAGTVYIPNIALRNELTIIVRTRLPFAQSAALLRAAVNRFDPGLALFDVSSLTEVIDRSVEARDLASRVLTIFGALALILASLGVYGVLSYATAERVPEIGIRLAIGATPANILAMIVRDGLMLIAVGMTIGLVVFLVLARFLASLIFGVSTFSLPLLAIGVCVVFATGMAATVVPARRASRVDPVNTLGAG